MKPKEVVLDKGYKANQTLPTMFTLVKENKIVAVMSSNVNDLLYGILPGAEQEMADILNEFSVKQKLDTEFRFCGKEVKQKEAKEVQVFAAKIQGSLERTLNQPDFAALNPETQSWIRKAMSQTVLEENF